MCYSARISLLTFSIGFGFSLLLTQSQQIFHQLMGNFLGFVSLMQFIEYLLWKHQICDSYNKSVSVIGMVLNHLQPVVLALLTLYFHNKNVIPIAILTTLFLAVIVPYSLQFTSDLQCSTTQHGSTDPHIVWQWNTMKFSNVAYIMFLATFVGVGLLGMPFNEGALFSAVAIVTYGLSSIIYDRKVMGSLWCFWTAFIPALIYFKSKFV